MVKSPFSYGIALWFNHVKATLSVKTASRLVVPTCRVCSMITFCYSFASRLKHVPHVPLKPPAIWDFPMDFVVFPSFFSMVSMILPFKSLSWRYNIPNHIPMISMIFPFQRVLVFPVLPERKTLPHVATLRSSAPRNASATRNSARSRWFLLRYISSIQQL